MLTTMRENLVKDRSNKTISGMITDANLNSVVRESFLDDMDDLSEEDLMNDEDMAKLIDDLPETEIEDAMMESSVKVKTDGGEEDMSLEQVEEMFIPETEY